MNVFVLAFSIELHRKDFKPVLKVLLHPFSYKVSLVKNLIHRTYETESSWYLFPEEIG